LSGLAEKNNIREVTLFPMNQNAQDLLMGAPSKPSEQQLKELNIKPIAKITLTIAANIFELGKVTELSNNMVVP